MQKILLIDNYDSFTFNLYHYLEELFDGEIEVMRNDEIDFERIEEFDAFVISPGPGLPKKAGDLMKFLNDYSQTKKILGICLGLQAIAEHFGFKLKNLAEVIHGQSHEIRVINRDNPLFHNLPSTFKVGRYHSWVIDENSLSQDFEISSRSMDGSIMSISHKRLALHAVQFHPESILTENGKDLLKNWLTTIEAQK